MYGTLLDQRVFESLVHKCLPSIHERFHAVDVQLSVASLPWFLSLSVFPLPFSSGCGIYLLMRGLCQIYKLNASYFRFPCCGLFLRDGTEGSVSSRVSWMNYSSHARISSQTACQQSWWVSCDVDLEKT